MVSRTTGTRAGAVLLLTGLAGAVLATAPVSADEHEHTFPEHGHVLLLGATFQPAPDGFSLTYRKCVDLASNQALPLTVQHQHLHFGRAGQALRQAGHLIVPLAPFPDAAAPLPFDSCASLAEIFPPNAR